MGRRGAGGELAQPVRARDPGNITPSAVPARGDFARLEERLRAEELRVAETDGDQRVWYFAAGAVLVLTLASPPLLRERDRRRVRQSAGG